MASSRRTARSLLLSCLALGAAATASSQSGVPLPDQLVPYPEEFRAWRHVKSAYVGPGPGHDRFGGLHHIYANEKALQGYRDGKFPDGAVIVFDLFEVETKANNLLEGKRRYIDVMHKDSARFSSTGGWGYAEFKGASRTERTIGPHNAAKECHECHTKQAGRDYVFSDYRD
jgi:hypothetical protein